MDSGQWTVDSSRKRQKIGIGGKPKPLFLCLLSTVCCLLVLSATPAQDSPPKKPLGNIAQDNLPVQIEAKTLTVLQQENKVIFETNVVLKRGPTVIQCNKLVAYYRKTDWEVQKAVCTGSVKVTHKDTYARCGEATFDNNAQLITMSGSPVIYQGENIFRGDVLKYYLASEKITGTNVRFQRNPKPPPRAPKANP